MKHFAFHINSFMKGGIERVLIQQLRAFDRSQVKLTLLITYQFPSLEVLLKEVPKDVEIIHLLDKRILNATRERKAVEILNPFVKIYDEFLQLPRSFYIKHRLKKLFPQFDVVIDFDITLGSYISKFKGPKIGWFHFSVANYHNGNFSKLKRLGKKFSYYNKVIVISDKMREEAVSMYPSIGDRFTRIYNGIDFANLRMQGQDLNQFSEADKGLLNQKFILSSGRLNEGQKDFTTLIRAFAAVANEIPHMLYLAGDGPHREDLEKLVAELGVQSRVRFLGFLANPLPFVKACDFFVHSSKFEGLPTVLLEALGFYKTVVASDCPTGPREILKEGDCGYLFPVGDEKELALIIKNIANGNYPRISAQTIKEQLESFDIQSVQRDFLRMKELAV